MTRRILVVGASGVLRPAALALASEGVTVVALARRPEPLQELVSEARGLVEPIAVDWTDLEATSAALAEHQPFSAALLYCPSASADVVAAFADATAGRVVRLLMSATAHPVVDEPFDLASVSVAEGARRLVLGWTGGRWHTPEEISAAALDVLLTGQERVLGVVRPWGDRPA